MQALALPAVPASAAHRPSAEAILTVCSPAACVRRSVPSTRFWLLVLAIAAAWPACEAENAADAPVDAVTTDTPAEDAPPQDTAVQDIFVVPTSFSAQLSDFDCVKNGVKVGRSYVANRLSPALQAEAVSIAQEQKKGAKYPIGTMIRLFPLEVMVKSGDAFASSGGWEMFLLERDKDDQLQIKKRGGAEVSNGAGPCFGCHAAAEDFDFVCSTNHGCVALGASDEFITALQDTDPACPAVP